jgi:catechol 2,3-dioxygenase-like lactoylglutathione lyase family enzyme
MLQIRLTSIMVEDQDKALAFYTTVLGFEKQFDFPVGGPFRWITVAAPGAPDVQLSLEPNENPIGKAFQQGLFEQRIPATAFYSTDVDAEYKRLLDAGVAFTRPPETMGPVKAAVFSDTVGNLIQIYQPLI